MWDYTVPKDSDEKLHRNETGNSEQAKKKKAMKYAHKLHAAREPVSIVPDSNPEETEKILEETLDVES